MLGFVFQSRWEVELKYGILGIEFSPHSQNRQVNDTTSRSNNLNGRNIISLAASNGSYVDRNMSHSMWIRSTELEFKAGPEYSNSSQSGKKRFLVRMEI